MNKIIPISSTPKKNSSHRHPNTQTMVDEAFKTLNKKKCSYRAVKQYIVTKYNVDIRFLQNRIKSYIRESLGNGNLIQMSGHGLNGSFRLSAAGRRKSNKNSNHSKRKLIDSNLLLRHTKTKLYNKSATFIIDPIRRSRTSLADSSTRKSLPKAMTRSPKPRLAKMLNNSKLKSKDNSDNNVMMPSTSFDAIQKMHSRNKAFKMSHML